MLLWQSASGNPENPSLRIPTDGDALHEPLQFQARRLIPVEYGLDDVGREEGEAHDAAAERGIARLNRTSKLARRENGRGYGENAAKPGSPGPAQNPCRREGPQTAANRTSGSNPTRFFCDIKDLLAEGWDSNPRYA